MKYLSAIVAVILISCLRPAPKWPGAKSSEILQVCWHDGPATSFAPAVVCEEGQEAQPIEWSSLPLIVVSDKLTALPTLQAINVWNDWLGFEAFVYEPLATDPDLVVLYGGPRSPGGGDAAAITVFERRRSDGKQHSIVAIFNSGLSEPHAYIHELGHVLGLAHDPDNKRSIMFTGLVGMFAPELETQDYSVLRHRYFFRR